MRQPGLVLCLLCLACMFPAGAIFAADLYQAGFRTMGQWRVEDKLRLDVNVWYPSVRRPRQLKFAPWEIEAALEGKAAEGRFPLLLLSHDTDGTRFSYHDTAARLAMRGFVVAAVTHSGDCMYNMDTLFSLEQLRQRAREISATLDLLSENAQTSQGIDANRIGIIGFGAGATTALLLGGALPDCGNWPEYCRRADSDDTYCGTWAKKRISELCAQLPLPSSLADPRIKAVAAVVPGSGMLFSQDSFRYFHPPLLLVGAENDKLRPPALHTDVLSRLLTGKARYVRIKNADSASFVAACPEPLEDDLPELCRTVSSADRNAIHQRMYALLSDFFLYYLGGEKNLPVIPDPPVLTKEEEPAPLPPPAPEKRRQRKPR